MAGLNKPGMEEEKNEERDTRGKRCTQWRRGEHEHENDVREQRRRKRRRRMGKCAVGVSSRGTPPNMYFCFQGKGKEKANP